MKPKRAIIVFALIVESCACTPGSRQPPAPAPTTPPARAPVAASPFRATPVAATQAYADRSWDFRIDVPRGWIIQHDFAHGYLAEGSWKTYAAPDAQGRPLVALALPGSNHITSAEIRIGASRNADDIAQCAAPPDATRAGSLHRVRIGDADFAAFEASDAAMSHYLDVHSYRTVRGGACYAIDLLVYGTNPGVYDPPARPPFSKEQAFAQMTTVLQTFRFTR